jgi:hypothetical protein
LCPTAASRKITSLNSSPGPQGAQPVNDAEVQPDQPLGGFAPEAALVLGLPKKVNTGVFVTSWFLAALDAIGVGNLKLGDRAE